MLKKSYVPELVSMETETENGEFWHKTKFLYKNYILFNSTKTYLFVKPNDDLETLQYVEINKNLFE